MNGATAAVTLHLGGADLFRRHPLPQQMAYRVVVHRETIPIVVVPGIMGSRLAHGSQRLWDPDDAWFMLVKYGLRGALARQRLLLGPTLTYTPSYGRVHHDDPHHNRRFANEHPDGVSRGWGGVAWNFYGPVLRRLACRRWPRAIGQLVHLPVYACGYDWRSSCAESGAALARTLTEITNRHGRPGRAIVITHSMGGLVARAALALHGIRERVLGVIHGVEPRTGAPTAYWRLRAGFERRPAHTPLHGVPLIGAPLERLAGLASAFVLGQNGLEVQSLLGNMPGALELLPHAAYRDNTGASAWLRLFGADHNVERELPRADPYREIYASDDEQIAAFRSAHLLGRRQAPTPDGARAWMRLQQRLNAASAVTKALAEARHSATQSFHGTGARSCDRIGLHKRWRLRAPVNGKAAAVRPALVDNGKLEQVLAERGLRELVLTLDAPDGEGDGTVPVSSAGPAPEAADATTHWAVPGLAHDAAFTDERVLTRVEALIEELCMTHLRSLARAAAATEVG